MSRDEWPGAPRPSDAFDDRGELAACARSDARRRSRARRPAPASLRRKSRRIDASSDCGQRVDEIGCAVVPARVHPHVERSVMAERETALGFVELERGHAEIEGDAIGLADAVTGEQRLHLGEAAMHQREPAAETVGERAAARDRVFVAIDRVDRAARAREQAPPCSRRRRTSRRHRSRHRGARAPPSRRPASPGRVRSCRTPVPCAAQRARALNALALHRFEAHRIPHLEFLAEADEDDALGDAGVGDADRREGGRVLRRRNSADCAGAENRLRLVVIVLAEQRIVFVEPLLELS